MQKLPEVSDKKKGPRMRKEKGDLPTRGAGWFSFRQWPANWQHLADWWQAWTRRWLVLSPVAALSVNSMPKYKRLRNGTTN